MSSELITSCIFIGGKFDGELHNEVDIGCGVVELSRADSLKPLESPRQAQPEINYITDKYTVHPVSLQNDEDDAPAMYGIAVAQGVTLTDAFERMAVNYANIAAHGVK